MEGRKGAGTGGRDARRGRERGREGRSKELRRTQRTEGGGKQMGGGKSRRDTARESAEVEEVWEREALWKGKGSKGGDRLTVTALPK